MTFQPELLHRQPSQKAQQAQIYAHSKPLHCYRSNFSPTFDVLLTCLVRESLSVWEHPSPTVAQFRVTCSRVLVWVGEDVLVSCGFKTCNVSVRGVFSLSQRTVNVMGNGFNLWLSQEIQTRITSLWKTSAVGHFYKDANRKLKDYILTIFLNINHIRPRLKGFFLYYM